MNTSTRTVTATLMMTALVLGSDLNAAETKPLRVCADPGNMPMSNNRNEGYQNKIAEVLAKSMGTYVTYFWRPSIERGMFRSTLDADECDVYFDMPPDTERVLTTAPLYRSTFVLAYREDRGYSFSGLDDPALKKLKIGVFQMSSIRAAFNAHGVKNNLVLHFISHDGDLVPENQPSYQVQQVINGELDVAAIWGPMAGYYKTVKKAPIVIQPVNVSEHLWEMEFDMSLAVRKRDNALKEALEGAMRKEQPAIQQILADYGVPLVKCDTCVLAGDLPSHGPYQKHTTHNMIAEAEEREVPLAERTVTTERVEQWLRDGANINQELNNAIIANDVPRAEFLIGKGADINSRDAQGYPPLVNAARRVEIQAVRFLVEHGANVDATDTDGWTALMFAAWRDSSEIVELLARHKVSLEARNPKGLTALAVAAQHGKIRAIEALARAGADVNVEVGAARYRPLMLAVAGGSVDTVDLLLRSGANVNAQNEGGISALMIAAANNRAEMAELLLKAGANPDATSQDGRNALAIAKASESTAVISILERKPG